APFTPLTTTTRTQCEITPEHSIHPLDGYICVTDKYEGLILLGAATTIDGDPTNNFLKREVTFDPGGALNGARAVTIVGTYAYVCCDAGLAVVSLSDPKHPEITAVLGEDAIKRPRAVQVQF